MAPGPETGRVVITGAGLVCPAASSVAELLKAPADGRDGAGAASGAWFDPVHYLGRHGWKYHSPATRYLLAAASLALLDASLDPQQRSPETMAAVIGTNFAANPVLARFDRTVMSEGADALSPAETPNFSVNLPASHVSMRYAMRGFNLSLTNPMVAGVEALLTLSAALRAGRAQSGLAGAVEERPDTPTGHLAPGEGACCFTLELLTGARARGASLRAEVAGGFSRFLPRAAFGPPPAADGLWASAVGRPLRALIGAETGPLPFAVLSGPTGLNRRLREYCLACCGEAGVPLAETGYLGRDGDHFTVSALFQVAGLIAEHGHGLVVCSSPHGHVAAVYLRSVHAAD